MTEHQAKTVAMAIALAKARIRKVYANGANTLIDEIPVEQFNNWDARDEIAIVGKRRKQKV